MINSDDDFGTYVTFIGKKQVNIKPIASKLGKIISDNILHLPEQSEEKEILQNIERALYKNITSKIVVLGNANNNATFNFSDQEWHWLLHHSEDLWIRYVIYRYKFKIFPEQKKITDFPIYLLIEPTSMCNLKCIMCFQVDKKFQQKKFMGVMPWKLFIRIVDEASEMGCPAFTFASRGEPTLHKDFGKMLRYTAKAGILDIKLNTNAMILTDNLIHDILSSGISEIVFSVDVATKKTYEEIRIGGRFEKVVSNIRKFHEIREKEYKDCHTITRISGVKISDEQDIDQMSDFWSNIVDEVTIKSAIPRWDTYNNPITSMEIACRTLWRQMYVWWDGVVNPCDFDYMSYLQIGNAHSQSLKEIWDGSAMNALRTNHLAGKRNCHMPCDKCTLN